MVFQRKKPSSGNSPGLPQPRSRENAGKSPDSVGSAVENPLARRFQLDEEPDTTELESAEGFHGTIGQQQDVPTTRILSTDRGNETPPESQVVKDPVSGFLVVISGPGRGSVSMLRYGRNSIGRDVSQAIALDYGDSRISRERHCTITYDPVTRKFYLQAGEGVNLTYLEDQPVLVVTQLTVGNHIRVGDTKLRFIPLCGKDFDWTED